MHRFEQALLLLPTHTTRFEFIEKIGTVCSKHDDVSQWCREKRVWATRNLKPLKDEEVPSLAELAKMYPSLLGEA